jgi:thiamine monophosphate synthase
VIPGRREVESDGHKTLKSLQTILTLLVTSSEFRLVINQAISLASSVLADGAHKVAENASEFEKKAREAGSDVSLSSCRA